MAVQWHHCPTHNRLCEIGSPRDETPSEAAWRRYQQELYPVIRILWEERQLLRLWLGLVEATHRDRLTMAYLSEAIRTGRWCAADIELARRLADRVNAEYLTTCI